MKFNLNEIMAMTKSLNVILEKELSVKPAYWLARFLGKVESEMKAMEKARLKLISKYAKKDKDGKPLQKKGTDQFDITEENVVKFTEEFDELCKEEVEIDFNPIKLDDLGDIKLTPSVLIHLGKIIVEK